jgi:hypothetical protein
MLLVSGTTATMRRLAPDNARHLGHLVVPSQRATDSVRETGLRWAADNGAFAGFDAEAFRRLLRQRQADAGCLWVACPDVVGDARATLARFAEWKDEIAGMGYPVALVGQDGVEDCEIPWYACAAWFVGGSTGWKLSRAAADLVGEARRRGKWCHMGRVNSLRRIRYAWEIGCDSVDGSSMSRFGDTHVPKFLRWVKSLERQPLLFGGTTDDNR